jgi:hypothetical protein
MCPLEGNWGNAITSGRCAPGVAAFDRVAFRTGIIVVVKSGIAWEIAPAERDGGVDTISSRGRDSCDG